MLLTGDEALWLLDVSTGELTSVVENAGSVTGQMFTPDGNAYLLRAGQRLVRPDPCRRQSPAPDDGRGRDRLQRWPGLGVQRGAGDPRGPAGLRLVARRRLADLSAPRRERRAQRPSHRLSPCPSDRQLHPLSDGWHSEPNRHAPRAGPGRDRAAAGGPAARRRRIRAAVLHLDAGLQSRALHHREPGSHRADPEHVDAAERRAARLDQGNRGRLDQRGSLCGPDLHRATAASSSGSPNATASCTSTFTRRTARWSSN